jgi:demethylmenaquinone methyltransferase / 2-methoxy-6-polyprenyl-1,4-benzoquinol methylase
MRNKFFSHDEQRAPRVRQLFTKLAQRYDLANDIQSFGMHRVWKRSAVRIALHGLPPGSRVLDICCGTGDMTFEARRRGAGIVVGVDFTKAMLDVALQRRAAAGVSAHFVQGDALRLPFADGSFDVVTIGYGLRNLADFEGGVREMLRVLRPGGRLVVLDFGKPANAFVRACYFGYLQAMMPLMGWLFHRDADTYVYIIESLREFPAQQGIEATMRRAGMTAVRVYNPVLGTMGINYGERTAA